MQFMWVFKLVFAGFGLIFGAVGIGWGLHTAQFVAEAERAQGEVVELVPRRSDGSTTYSPAVRFRTASGELIDFTSSGSSNPPGYRRGETVTVAYDPQRPEAARLLGFTDLWLGPLIFGLFGLTFGGIGFGLIVHGWLRQRTEARLFREGTPVQADFVEVIRDTSFKVNGRSPYRLVAQWLHPATREMHVFRSAMIWYDPGDLVKSAHLTVFIDPDDPSTYVMDTAFLPRRA